ncbi:uncharacterized protein LOC135195719 [Macrobrachium nipponense]|uniref:uncharacterized protein LOC135195719 n=1 Tax=Macrobrachium nipponense TaxID=159736 RepID=UPI0030C86C20
MGINFGNMEKANDLLVKAGLQPVSKSSLLFYYMPMKGVISYTMLASQMLTPELYQDVTIFRFFGIPQYISLTNACLVNSLTGTALYLYSRPHLAKAAPKERILFCAFGSTIFNLGSMLAWALGSTVAPGSPALRFLMGVGGAVGRGTVCGKRYIAHVDSQVKIKE